MPYRATQEFYYSLMLGDITVYKDDIVSDWEVKEYNLEDAIKQGWLVSSEPPTWQERLLADDL
jgi:hypothetical protein